ncbi:GTPase-activating protein gyp7-like isoform X2 [Gossypium arboreum]|uniref:GTPase-activating protein gyp7-like isoform X2 n=1 Tax=Gossypium arboreum TaxID=29729 RepID=UPI0008196D6C|nr:GTPase-activating protein gyp7-like isoform X2 [Gossypium arboreum]
MSQNHFGVLWQNGMHSQLFALSKLVELLDKPLHKYFEQNDCLNYFFCFRWILIHFKRYFWLAWSSLVLTLKACWLNKMNKFTVLRDLNFVAKNLGVEFFKGTLVV